MMKKSEGFGLIEVLIAMAIISIGFLGTATLISAVKLSSAAQYNLTASIIAADLATRIKLNFVDARKGSMSIYNDPSSSNGADNNCNVSGTSCTPTKLGQNDLFQIYNMAKNSLPNGEVKVCFSRSTDANCLPNLAIGPDIPPEGGCYSTSTSFQYPMFNIVVTWDVNQIQNSFIQTVKP